ncbi:hypothetical protein [Sphaerisporangium fuscum]|uniref:hypothetical protein n=1 Tax=Sphaerisporangium fuscum TaxID=2835868 RepID=UPI001BDC88DD|nr:hypothetical protein [Sphaerisporangium fuscum]
MLGHLQDPTCHGGHIAPGIGEDLGEILNVQVQGVGDGLASQHSRPAIDDEWVRRFLSDNPGAVVLDVGCGLESRVFRIDPAPGRHWYDVDFAGMIILRDRLYPSRPDHTSVGAELTDAAGWSTFRRASPRSWWPTACSCS